MVKQKRDSISKFIRLTLSIYDLRSLSDLQLCAKIKVPRECHGNWNYKLKRSNFNKGGFMRDECRKCVLCGSIGNGRYVDRHHVIPLEMGGVSIKENIIGLCRSCHSEVHGFEVG